jgi:hypothetical protein
MNVAHKFRNRSPKGNSTQSSVLCHWRPASVVFFAAIMTWSFIAEATTIGGAMGNASADARPIVWKNRDGGEATGNNRHFLSLVTDRTYLYLGVHPSDLNPRMGLSETGIGFGNALGHPNDGSSSFTQSPNYDYSNNQAFKQFVLGEATSLEQVRQAIIDNTLGSATDWPQSLGIMAGIFDANGKVSMWEIGDAEFYEYNPENPVRLAQIPWQIYARDNTVHTRSDHTDNWGRTSGRYTTPRDQLITAAESGGNTMTDMIRIARTGEPDFDNLQSRTSTSVATIAHGVLPGEDPHIATMWVALGSPDYAAFIPTWVTIGDNLSPRVSSNDLSTTIGGAAELLWGKREPNDYDLYINSLLEPMERNFILAVEAARDHWFRNGFQINEARRIHNEASETAWQTMNVMAAGSSRSLNMTPELSELSASIAGSTVSFTATANDPDGSIVAYDWDFGDGSTSTTPAPVRTFQQDGTYLVRVRVTDNVGSSNSRWIYVTLGAPTGLPLVTISAADATAAEPGADTAVFTVTRTGSTTGDISVNFSVLGSAIEGNDYQPVGNSITIPDGLASATIVIIPINDAFTESSETVIATLASGTGYAVGRAANATIEIDDDETVEIFGEGDVWRYFKGTELPAGVWASLGYDDATWLTGATGIGYGDGDDNTVLDDMSGNYATVYMRYEFAVADPALISRLTLNIDYDDGFVAFINGTEVARAGVATGQDNNTLASDHEAGSPESIDLSSYIHALQPGDNVFAIEVHNTTLGSSDLSMIPQLIIDSGASACNDGIDNDGDGLVDFPTDPGCDDVTDLSELATAEIFGEGDVWRYFKGTELPAGVWASLGYDDATWLTGATGIGYGDGDDNTVLDDMSGNYATVYMRNKFTVSNPSTVSSLTLNIDYDDGFVAFINGTEVARAGVATGQDNNTLASNHGAGSPESIDLSSYIHALQPGDNVFAIEVHNTTLGSSDLSMIPQLIIEKTVVSIDVLPGDETNKVYPNKSGKLSVGVLSSAEFDAMQVDPAALKFGSAEAGIANDIMVSDLDGQLGNDIIAVFRVGEAGIFCNDTEVMLTGATYSGDHFEGVDMIDATECESGGCHVY